MFKARLVKPEKGNKYYIRKASGGYSDAIQGNPKDAECDVLSNCVGYSYGRFNEVGNYGSCKYLQPVNAGAFMDYKGSLPSGTEPKIGAVMVWRKKGSTNGAGHVANVEKVWADGSITTSESSYGGKAFYTKKRYNNDKCWGESATYEFLGFIYNPAVSDAEHYKLLAEEAIAESDIYKKKYDAFYSGYLKMRNDIELAIKLLTEALK